MDADIVVRRDRLGRKAKELIVYPDADVSEPEIDDQDTFNRAVTLSSTYVATEPMCEVRRFDRKAAKQVSVKCPAIANHYNQHMGGVDKFDMLMALVSTRLENGTGRSSFGRFTCVL